MSEKMVEISVGDLETIDLHSLVWKCYDYIAWRDCLVKCGCGKCNWDTPEEYKDITKCDRLVYSDRILDLSFVDVMKSVSKMVGHISIAKEGQVVEEYHDTREKVTKWLCPGINYNGRDIPEQYRPDLTEFEEIA